MLECRFFAEINGCRAECVCGYINFQWVCVRLNPKYGYLLILTCYLSLGGEYMHSCETGQY